MVRFLLHNTVGAWWAAKQSSTGILPVKGQGSVGILPANQSSSGLSSVALAKGDVSPVSGEGTQSHAGETPAPPTLDEAALRRHAEEGLGGYTFEYLRFVEDPHSRDGCATPAAGTFPGWPRTARELRILDPCCGSGHFLVEVFDLLVRLRMAEEGLSAP